MSVKPEVLHAIDPRPLGEIAAEFERDLGVTPRQARRLARRAKGLFADDVIEVDGPKDARLAELGIKLGE